MAISPIVSEYYERFFDSVDSYHQMVRDEIDDFRKDIADFHWELAFNPSVSENSALVEKITSIQRHVDQKTRYQESDKIVSDAITYAANILESKEPELTARFKSEPVNDKYRFLTEKYEVEHGEIVQKRISGAEQSFKQAAARLEVHSHFRPTTLEDLTSFGKAGREWSRRHKALERETVAKEEKWRRMARHADLPFVMDMEKGAAAENKVKTLFPDITKQYLDEERKRHEELLRDATFQLGEELLADHMVLYVKKLADELTRAESGLDYANSLLSEHRDKKPGLLRTIVTLGRAQVVWREKEAELRGDVAYCAGELSKAEANRREVDNGGGVEWVDLQIREKYPMLRVACDAQEREQREQARKFALNAHEVERDGMAAEKGLAR